MPQHVDANLLRIIQPGSVQPVSSDSAPFVPRDRLQVTKPTIASLTPWKTTYDVPGGNGLIGESPIMSEDEAVDFIVNLGREWGDMMPELADVDPEMPGIGGLVVEGEHVQGPPKMLSGTLHGDCGDFLCVSSAIFQARRELQRDSDGNWESPMGTATLFEEPDAPQDHVAWSQYDHMATRPRQVGGWFDEVKKLAKKAAPTVLAQMTGLVAPWAAPLLTPVFERAMGPKTTPAPTRRDARTPIRPPYAQPGATGRRIPSIPMRYRATVSPKRPWVRYPTKAPQGQSPLYLPPMYANRWQNFKI